MSEDGYWFLALAIGLVVAVVAVVLLEALLRQVHRVERGAGLVWTAGKQVAGNTSTTWLLGEVSDRLASLGAEARQHAQLLGEAPTPPNADEPGPTAVAR